MSFSINTAALSTRNRQRSRPVLGRQKGSMHKDSSLNFFTVHYSALTLLSEHETLVQSNLLACMHQLGDSRVLILLLYYDQYILDSLLEVALQCWHMQAPVAQPSIPLSTRL